MRSVEAGASEKVWIALRWCGGEVGHGEVVGGESSMRGMGAGGLRETRERREE